MRKLTSWKSHNYFFIPISLPSTGSLVIFCESFTTSAFVRKMKIRKSTSSLLFYAHDFLIPLLKKTNFWQILTNRVSCNFATSLAGENIHTLLDKFAIPNSYRSIPTVVSSAKKQTRQILKSREIDFLLLLCRIHCFVIHYFRSLTSNKSKIINH